MKIPFLNRISKKIGEKAIVETLCRCPKPLPQVTQKVLEVGSKANPARWGRAFLANVSTPTDSFRRQSGFFAAKTTLEIVENVTVLKYFRMAEELAAKMKQKLGINK